MAKRSVDVAPEMRGSEAEAVAVEEPEMSPWLGSGVKVDGEVMKLLGRSNVVKRGKEWEVRYPRANSC